MYILSKILLSVEITAKRIMQLYMRLIYLHILTGINTCYAIYTF